MNLTKPSLKTGMNESVVKEIKENPPELGKKYITLNMKELQYYITLPFEKYKTNPACQYNIL